MRYICYSNDIPPTSVIDSLSKAFVVIIKEDAGKIKIEICGK